jgi:hypothetical protein
MKVVETICKIFRKEEKLENVVDYTKIYNMALNNNRKIQNRESIFNCYILNDRKMLEFVRNNIYNHEYNIFIEVSQKLTENEQTIEYSYLTDLRKVTDLKTLKMFMLLRKNFAFCYSLTDYDGFDVTINNIPTLLFYKGHFLLQFGRIDDTGNIGENKKLCRQILAQINCDYDDKEYQLYF